MKKLKNSRLSTDSRKLQTLALKHPRSLVNVCYYSFKIFLRFWLAKGIRIIYGGPQLSGQNQNPHGKNKKLTAKPKTSRQKQNTSRQNQILHGKSKYLTAKANISRQKQKLTAKANTSRQKQILHGKSKYFTAKAKTHGKSKYLTAKANTARQKQILTAKAKTHGKS